MATESDVDISGAHPYWAYPFSDIAVVHNGQLTNYFYWRRRLERNGHRFQSHCDSEIIAVYIAEKMSEGKSLEESMHDSLDELDGVFTYICVTKDALGVAKDEMAAKPLVLYESEGARRARLRGDRDPQGRRARDLHLRPVREGGAGVDALTGEARITYDARGLVEPDATVPSSTPEIDGGKAVFDAENLTTRQINLELRWLIYEQGIRDVTVRNPGSKHSIGVGILQRCSIRYEGSLGYFGCGLIDGPEVHITGRVGWSACENMMSGVVIVDGNGGSLWALPCAAATSSCAAGSAPARASTRRAARSSSATRSARTPGS